MARDYRLTGDAGTFLVGAELALRGWPSALTTAGTTRTDVLAQVGARKLAAAVQVKTKSERSRDVQPGGVNEPAARLANEWVVLVALAENREHRFYVVPRDVVVTTVWASRLVFNSRVVLDEGQYRGYEGFWEALEEPSWAAPWRLQEWVFECREKMTWPDGHSGIPADCEVRPNGET